MTEILLEPNEINLGTWTIIYISSDGTRYNGNLTVTTSRLLYDAKFDISVKGLFEESLFIKFGSIEYFTIPKKRIANVETKKNFIKKQIVITLDNGQIHTFDYGMQNIDKLSEAINQK